MCIIRRIWAFFNCQPTAEGSDEYCNERKYKPRRNENDLVNTRRNGI